MKKTAMQIMLLMARDGGMNHKGSTEMIEVWEALALWLKQTLTHFFSAKGHLANILSFSEHEVSIRTIPKCCCSVQTATGYTQMNEHGSFPVKCIYGHRI